MSPENPPDDFTSEEQALLSNMSEMASSITQADRERIAPPPDIWEGISSEIFGSTDENLIDLTSERSNREAVAATTPPAPTATSASSAPVPHSTQRSPLLLVAAAIIGLLVIGGASIAVLGGDSSPVYAADISNADLPEPYEGTATAEIDDARTLMIEFDDELPSGEPVELWLIRPDLSDMVSLGIVEPGDTTWEVPEGIDPTEYSIVDLSIEPDDGDETHSGRSILRGELSLEA